MLLFLLLIITIASTTTNDIESDQPLPKFDQSYETVSVVVGKRALLPCYVSLQDMKNNGLGSFKVIWMKLNNSSILTMEDRAINGDSRISLLHAYAEEWNLQIDDIDEDDAGVYRCFINNGMYKTLVLEVKVPPKIIDELTTEPYPYPIRSGSNFTIKCYAHGKPTPRIRILSYDQYDNIQIISEQNEVTIFNISRHTNRRYECVASNDYPPDVARSFQLTIQFLPEISLFINDNIISNKFFLINSNTNEIRLKCQVIMHPFDKIYWIKDKKKLNYSYQLYHIGNYVVSELIIKYLTSNDQGEYTCIASNLIGTNSKSIQLIASSTTTITTTTTTERLTTRYQRTKYVRPITIVSHSTESLRMMTLSSKSKLI
ncbi:unnamed protein product [Rotaria sp. Silwood2]|nr:unnamed protein product [Rotaria sp. Silwood2]CAF2863417.1 unnamed protein product [Rotaria sp. Silwood2]CAF4329613.1 unnamed protein product [Rotaria sp. Silwood2]CAF4345427.1 unnamed protein product [Rotaria sp. Silwood2]